MRSRPAISACALLVPFLLASCKSGQGDASFTFKEDGRVEVQVIALTEWSALEGDAKNPDGAFGSKTAKLRSFKGGLRSHQVEFASLVDVKVADLKIEEQLKRGTRTIRINVPLGPEAAWWKLAAPNAAAAEAYVRMEHEQTTDPGNKVEPPKVTLQVRVDGSKLVASRISGDPPEVAASDDDNDGPAVLKLNFAKFGALKSGTLTWESDWAAKGK
jgi:hypothetical protein